MFLQANVALQHWRARGQDLPALALLLRPVIDAENPPVVVRARQEAGMTRSKRAASVPVAHQQWRLPLGPAFWPQRVLSVQREQGQLVVAGPAPVGRVDDAAEPSKVYPRRSLVHTSPPTIRSLPGVLRLRDAHQRVSDGLFGRRHLDEEEVLLGVAVISKRPSGPATVEVVAADGEDRRVNGPMIGHSLQRTKELPAARVHGVKVGGSQEHGAMAWVPDPRRGRASVDVP